VFSTTKGMAAITLAMLNSRGYLNYDEKVVTYWPEFGHNGKQNITVRQLISHQAGLADLDVDFARFSCSCVGFRPELGSSGGGGRFVAGLDRFRQTGPTPCKHESLGSLRDAVEAAPDVAHQGMPDNEHSGGTARLQSTHRSEAFFQEAVVTFDAIGAVAASSMQYARHHRGQGWRVRARPCR
jgi:hypothetical protein